MLKSRPAYQSESLFRVIKLSAGLEKLRGVYCFLVARQSNSQSVRQSGYSNSQHNLSLK